MANGIFSIKHRDKKTKARVGVLSTRSGKIETPFFMPVATKTAVKHISACDLHKMEAKAVISNAFVLFLRPGCELIKKMGGIAKFMSFNGIVFTDSGGFQMYSPRLYVKSKEDGVVFRNPYTLQKLFVTPEGDMEIQLALGSDVAMCLDVMPLISESKESIAEAVRKTGRWAKRCKVHHDKLQNKLKEGKKQLLFGIIQGGIHSDLRKISARELVEMDFEGYSIGGLALGEPKEEEYKMIEVCKKIIPEDKPVYLMGAGDPLELLEAISRGVDIFDSRFPTQNARRGAIFTSEGRINLTAGKFREDKNPIDSSCSCFVCKNYSRAYIRHLLLQEEGAGLRLASYHNLHFLQRLMEDAREAIKKGKFAEFLRVCRKNFGN
ncbi:MAG: tRNA guanosine(34) transglycosylase Tgt [archaeon]|jgi:queuine tRNA-ribosyltransferase|nr:tRNA guanosine(34) transglycosylase Tgt [archaeon]